MYKVIRPSNSISEFFRTLIVQKHNNEKNNFLRTRLLAIENILYEKEIDYIEKLDREELHKIVEHDYIDCCLYEELINKLDDTREVINISEQSIKDLFEGGESLNISSEEMEKLYSQDLVGKKEGREVYNQILANTDYNLCPYCSLRDVKTVDHYLPKSKFPTLAVTPINLIPACRDCNTTKLDVHGNSEEELLLHPYFDDVSNLKWLSANILKNNLPITFEFSVANFLNEEPILYKRIQRQFSLLELGGLYANHATREFRDRSKMLIKNFDSGGLRGAEEYVRDIFETYSADINSWQSCMAEAIISSDWIMNEQTLEQIRVFYNID
jgi:hypothetical protein